MFGNIQKNNIIKVCIVMVFHMEKKVIVKITNLQKRKVFLDCLKIMKSSLKSFWQKAIDTFVILNHWNQSD